MTADGPDAPLPRGLIEALAELAQRAGRAIMPYFRREITVEHKADHSPVTEADRAADRLIVSGLRSLTPGIPVVSEESVDSGPALGGRGRFWLVDPLDGTKEFLAGRDEFTVNIALVEDGLPRLGVVGLPAREILYAAAGPDRATVREAGGAARHIVARVSASDGLVALVSRSHANREELDSFFADLPVKDRIVAGSALKFCLIAEGRADIYPRFGRTMEWDTAAGHAVLLAAGGSVRTLAGDELLYGKPGYENPPFVARGREA